MYTNFREIWEGWTKNLFAGLRYSIPNLVLALLFTFAFSVLGHVLFALGALQLVGQSFVSDEFMIWGTAIMVACQGTRGLMDVRRGMNLTYGLTHAPANILVMLLLINSAVHSLMGTVTWKGRTYKPTDSD
jgi:chlorobactene glucosyltransferase